MSWNKVLWAFKYCVRSAMSFLEIRICAMGCRICENNWSQRLMRRHCPMAARACTFGSCLGRLPISMRRRPIPIAPEETMTTLWPSFRRLTAVSTIRERMERRGWLVFSSTMEEVPFRIVKVRPDNNYNLCRFWVTKLDHDSEMFLHDVDWNFATYDQSLEWAMRESSWMVVCVNFVHPTSLSTLRSYNLLFRTFQLGKWTFTTENSFTSISQSIIGKNSRIEHGRVPSNNAPRTFRLKTRFLVISRLQLLHMAEVLQHPRRQQHGGRDFQVSTRTRRLVWRARLQALRKAEGLVVSAQYARHAISSSSSIKLTAALTQVPW